MNLFRMTRFQFLATVMPLTLAPPPKRERARRASKPSPRWAYQLEIEGKTHGGIVAGQTRSEARARIKERLAIKKKGRLPVGVTIERLPDRRQVAA